MVNKTRIQFFAVVFMLLSILGSSPLFAKEAADNSITIVYNNIPGNATSSLRVGGGLSAFIVFRGQCILFDAGGDASILVSNIETLGLDLAKLDAVVISHNHWDHVYGLPGIYSLLESNPKVYVTGSSKDAIKQQYPRADVVPVEEPVEICACVWSTGAIATAYRDLPIWEQSLILDDDNGLYVITGCSHPGIVKIIERVRSLFPEKPVALVTGGFHLVSATRQEVMEISARLKELGVKKLAPSHCTGRLATEVFKEDWRENCIRLYRGDTYSF